jgi:hypothetical protein
VPGEAVDCGYALGPALPARDLARRSGRDPHIPLRRQYDGTIHGRRTAGRRDEMSEFDLLVLAPWLVFAGGVLTIMIMLLSRSRHRDKPARSRRARRKRR